MLTRTLTAAICTVAFSNVFAGALERQVIGTWLDENSSAPPAFNCYYIFRRDHTLIRQYRNGDRMQPSTWRVRGDEFIEYWRVDDRQRIDLTRPIIRGDTLSFGVHETRIQQRDGTWKRERWSDTSRYKRVPTRKASNHAMRRTPPDINASAARSLSPGDLREIGRLQSVVAVGYQIAGITRVAGNRWSVRCRGPLLREHKREMMSFNVFRHDQSWYVDLDSRRKYVENIVY